MSEARTAKTDQDELPLEGAIEGAGGEVETEPAGSCSADPCTRSTPRYRPIDRNQVRLVKLDIQELVGPDHAVRAIWELVQRLNLEAYERPIKAVEGVAGRRRADVRVLISIWVYAFSIGETSGRELERMLAYEPGLRWLSGDQTIGYHTLNSFRSQNEEALRQLFVEVLGVMRAEGMAELKRVMQDGSKVRAAAGSDSFRRQKNIGEAMEEAQQHLDELLKEEAAGNPQQSARKAAARKRAAQERVEKLQAAQEALKQVEQTRINKGKDPAEARASATDPDARTVRQDGGGVQSGYNAQNVVDAKMGVIAACFVSQCSSDAPLLKRGLDEVERNLGVRPSEMVADAGYTSKRTIHDMAQEGTNYFGSLPDLSQREDSPLDKPFRAAAFRHDPETDTCTCPAGQTLVHIAAQVDDELGQTVHTYRAPLAECASCPLKSQCCPKANKTGRSIQRIVEGEVLIEFRKKMQTEEARAIYRQRSQRAEFPFAVIKQRMRLRQFRLRCLKKVGMEWMWGCLTFNILQWIRLRTQPKCALAAA